MHLTCTWNLQNYGVRFNNSCYLTFLVDNAAYSVYILVRMSNITSMVYSYADVK